MRLLPLTLALLLLAGCADTGSGDPADLLTSDAFDSSGQDLADDDTTDLADDDATDDSDDTAADPDAQPADTVAPVQPVFAAPQALLPLPDQGLLLVSNTNGYWDNDLFTMVYGPGYVSVLDRDDLSLRRDIQTSAVNPQTLARTPGGVAVLCSGTTAFDENWTASPATPGALDLWDADLNLLASVPLPNHSVGTGSGFPTSLVVLGDRAFIGSGIAPAIWAVDTATQQLVATRRLHNNPGNELLSLLDAGGKLGVLAFNSETLSLLDPATLQEIPGPCTYPFALDLRPETLTGPQGAVFRDGRIYIINALTSTLSVFDPATCELESQAAVLGGAPNQIFANDTFAFVVNSLDNNLQRLALDDLDSTVPFVTLPPGCNPWNGALDGPHLFVTGFVDQRVYRADLDSGDLLGFVPEVP
jgi:DNA-binding beta-propeller fold protein YncE